MSDVVVLEEERKRRCSHPTLHGPTPNGAWICNKCGVEVTTEGRE